MMRLEKYSDKTLNNMKKETLIEAIRRLERICERLIEANDNQYRLLIEIDRNKYKYKWHDLRKNPKDLPEFKGFCVDTYDVKVSNYEFPFGAFWDGLRFTDVDGHLICGVIAWKRIEPFEEESK